MSDNPSASNANTSLDPEFFACVNEYLEVANRQMQRHGSKRVSAAILHAAARCNVHMFLGVAQASKEETETFFRYMTDLYARMLGDNFVLQSKEKGLSDPRTEPGEPARE